MFALGPGAEMNADVTGYAVHSCQDARAATTHPTLPTRCSVSAATARSTGQICHGAGPRQPMHKPMDAGAQPFLQRNTKPGLHSADWGHACAGRVLEATAGSRVTPGDAEGISLRKLGTPQVQSNNRALTPRRKGKCKHSALATAGAFAPTDRRPSPRKAGRPTPPVAPPLDTEDTRGHRKHRSRVSSETETPLTPSHREALVPRPAEILPPRPRCESAPSPQTARGARLRAGIARVPGPGLAGGERRRGGGRVGAGGARAAGGRRAGGRRGAATPALGAAPHGRAGVRAAARARDMARPPGGEQELERLAALALRPRLGVRGSWPPGRLRRTLARGGGAGAGPAGRSPGGVSAGGGDGAEPERGAASGYGYPPPASVGADAAHSDAAAETEEKAGAPLAFVNKGGLRTAAARPGGALNLILRLCPWRDHARDPGWGGGKRLCGGRGRVLPAELAVPSSPRKS
ncbi:uncharacterized protein AAG666_001470 [Megaptera novaeangliae]